MESTLPRPVVSPAKGMVIGYWIFTALLCLQMGFTAYAQLSLPQVSQAFTELGYPGYFRVELSWFKIAAVLALLVPQVPARLKEWAYCGFALTLVSAIIAHFSSGQGFYEASFAIGTSVLWAFSYFFWRKCEAAKVGA
ncbi:MAG: DoxX family protein [Archangiaceae bacterium]|nr:DoxX family protein [Archangiaceae bacterium]